MSDKVLLQQFMKRYNSAKTMADLWMGLHQSCYAYAIPSRNKFWRPREQQGELRGSRVYDTTPIEAVKTFVSKMQSIVAPPQTQWAFLKLDPAYVEENPDEADAAQLVLNKYMERVFEYIHQSNFDVSFNESLFDLSVGTSCLVSQYYKDDCPLRFTSVPMDKLFIEDSLNGTVETWFRNWEDVKVSEILTRWPKATIPEKLLSELKRTPQLTIRLVYEGVMYCPREEKPYFYGVAWDEGWLYKEYLDNNPGTVWRFQKTNNDTYGRGPVMDALPSIVTLNEIMKLELASANLNVFRPYMAFGDGVFNPMNFTMRPMSIIPIASVGASGQFPLQPLPASENPAFAQITIADLRLQVQRLLFADSPIPEDSTQPVSASQIMVSNQMMSTRMGPLFPRFNQEFLRPTMHRVMYILDKAGILRMPKIKGAKMTFHYQSPLALSKGMEKISSFTQFYQLLQGTIGEQNAITYVNTAKAPYILANYMQVDPALLNGEEAHAQAMQSAQDMMVQQSQQEQEAQ